MQHYFIVNIRLLTTELSEPGTQGDIAEKVESAWQVMEALVTPGLNQ